MTTGAMVLGVRPSILARGTGFDIGLVIATGMLINRFVVPVMYILLAANRRDRHDEGVYT
jgi:multidrug efflux pump subunit AcrB